MRFLTLIFSLLALFPSPAKADSPVWEEFSTNLSIYVKNQDGKFIGTSMGGAHVRIINKMTGDVLAEGTTYGSTGDTEKIMTENKKRDHILIDKDTASLDFSLDIMEPTQITIKATGPMAQPQSLTSVSQDMLLIPGKDYSSGNGIIIELPGLVVDILAPMANQHISFSPDKPVTFVANISKLCGCKIEEGSLWPPERYDVEAHVFFGTQSIGSFPLNSMGKSQYATNLKVPVPGIYTVTVTAFDRETKEGGFDKTTMVLVSADEGDLPQEEKKSK